MVVTLVAGRCIGRQILGPDLLAHADTGEVRAQHRYDMIHGSHCIVDIRVTDSTHSQHERVGTTIMMVHLEATA